MAIPARRRVGVFGGTFDPVHIGHLILAEQCREAGGLDEVWFVPAGNPPHKQDHFVARFDQRVEMIELAIAGYPAFRVEPIENERPGLSYTADTLEELNRRHPDTELCLLIGSDALNDMPMWYEPQRIVASASLMVMMRANYPMTPLPELREALLLPPGAELRVQYVPMPPLIDISSSDLRRRVGDGLSIRYLVPRAVECYIAEKRLYRT
jgi:nicotinate-nucleotide adenylyltransferase